MRCITHCKLWHVVIFRRRINTCMVYSKGKAWIITLTQLTVKLWSACFWVKWSWCRTLMKPTCWKMSVSKINLSLHCRFPPSTVTSPLHASYKLMKRRHDAISIFTVQYKAINRSAWITVNNLRDMMNVAPTCATRLRRRRQLVSRNATITSTATEKCSGTLPRAGSPRQSLHPRLYPTTHPQTHMHYSATPSICWARQRVGTGMWQISGDPDSQLHARR